ncbi:MAG: hypothetical protein IT561_15310 [Alphaproteobacteria bacterium]|nr:hypothetical protein [Alphaproteobacteria bacterium]
MRTRAAHLLISLAAVALVAGTPSAATAQASGAVDVGALFREVLANPTDVQANLRYARAVEARGEGRKALMAYERILSVEPGHVAARTGLARLTGGAPAARTEFLVGLGFQYESNPRLLDTEFSRSADVAALATLRIEDERLVDDRRWRSRLNIQGRLYSAFADGTVGYAGADTGPVLSLGDLGEMRVLAGGEHARLKSSPLFSAIYGGAEVAFRDLGPLRGLDALVSYADFSERFPGRDGFLFRVRPQLSWTGLATTGDRLTVEPELSYNAAVGEDHRYRYWSVGAVAFYAAPLLDDVPLFAQIYGGPEAGIEYRSYAGRAPGEDDDRRDWRFVPGVRLVGTQFLDQDVSAVLRYTLDRNRSNETAKEYTNHTVSLMFYRRF